MGLRGKEWFFKMCMKQTKEQSPIASLCQDLLDKGVGQKDRARGHVIQAIGATQKFFDSEVGRPFVELIRELDETSPCDVDAVEGLIDAWLIWFADQSGPYGREAFGYNFDTLKTYLPERLGGRVRTGGGGFDEFKRVLRVMAGVLD